MTGGDRLLVALVGGPMYDHLYGLLDPDAVEVLRRARTILVGISAGLDRAAARLIEEES